MRRLDALATQLAAAAVFFASVTVLAHSPRFGVGHSPTDEDTRRLGIVVAPDGTGLPPGSGTAAAGKELFATRCAACHGPTGEGGAGPALVGGQGTLATPRPKRLEE